MQALKLNITGTNILIQCKSSLTYALLHSIYGSMLLEEGTQPLFKLIYTVDSNKDSFHIEFPDHSQYETQDRGDFLFQFEQHLVVQLQLARPELFFLHSAIVEFQHRGIALIAPSGSGKSTTTWGLLHEGFQYLTDEMSGIHLDTLEISPFSHAVSLKKPPPAPYPLPDGAIKTSRAYNIPVDQLPGKLYKQPLKLDTILYVKYSPDYQQAEISPVGTAESCSQLYTNSLNPLSHNQDGLDAAMQIAQNTRAFALKTCDLQSSCLFIKDFLKLLFSAH